MTGFIIGLSVICALVLLAEQAKRENVSVRTMYRRLAKGDMVTANGNGKARP